MRRGALISMEWALKEKVRHHLGGKYLANDLIECFYGIVIETATS
jgi:hypothetical protein